METYTHNELTTMADNHVSFEARGYVDGKLSEIRVGYNPDVNEWNYWIF